MIILEFRIVYFIAHFKMYDGIMMKAFRGNMVVQ